MQPLHIRQRYIDRALRFRKAYKAQKALYQRNRLPYTRRAYKRSKRRYGSYMAKFIASGR